ncbi:uncharacterized protein LOC126659922 [Mercurialis annua]|uniref:uncharacterized protein LOC126659922 n=1 Tax=Mercurialis annua TaxID=3986 RepID=UPI00215F457E|nr:uncharacterized protein LOC126659922 [Mercurialis annua]
MTTNPKSLQNDRFFTSLISDIKSYSGKDPLLPWLRGIKKMKETLASNVLKEKLPRFLQKCTQTFESDRCYRNDLRYIRVWLQLMDFVDEPKALLRTMEMNSIGIKRSLFYQAYALYYEKMKKFEEAEKMYHLGVQNLAEPVDELQKSYDQFLHRVERHRNKKVKLRELRTGRKPLSVRKIVQNDENVCNFEGRPKEIMNTGSQIVKQPVESTRVSANSCKAGDKIAQITTGRQLEKSRMFCGDDTVVVRFVDTAIIGKPEAEDACHHGLVDPTINMKEAMNAINSMFREPLETGPVSKRSQSSQHNLNNRFNVFVDENLSNRTESSHRTEEKADNEPFQIFIDDDENGENRDETDENDQFDPCEGGNSAEGSRSSNEHQDTFVFCCPKDPENSNDISAENSPRVKLREDTVVRRFVGSTILDEPAVENACHHGLVDPTVNLKEAMDDINNMFGKPIDFVRKRRAKQQEKAPAPKEDLGGFSILADDDLEHKNGPPLRKTRSSGVRDADLFEPTVFTKEALDDINKMFGMPLDF